MSSSLSTQSRRNESSLVSLAVNARSLEPNDVTTVGECLISEHSSIKFDPHLVKMNPYFRAHTLLQSSDNLIEAAHGNYWKVHISVENVMVYNKLVKAAIGCLMVLTQKYSRYLEPQALAKTYLKLARLYFEETKNGNLAEEAANKCISIAARNGLSSIQFQAQYFVTEVLFTSNVKLAWNFLNKKIEEYSAQYYQDEIFLILFTMLKYKYALLLSPEHAHTIIEALEESIEGSSPLEEFVSYHSISSMLYSGKLELAELKLNELSCRTFTGNDRPQFKAMRLFYQLWYNISINDTTQTKISISQLDAFVKEQDKKKWKDWSQDGSISFVVKTIPYKIDWLPKNQCVFMLYLMAGISYLPKSYDGKGKSQKFFDTCLKVLDQDIASIHRKRPVMSLQDFENFTGVHSYLVVLVSYYKVLARFNSGVFELHPSSSDASLFEFVQNYDEGSFSSQELALYHKLVSHLLYLFGAYYQSRQETQIAKSYYMRLRSHLEKPSIQHSAESRFMSDPFLLSLYQLELGLGPDSKEKRHIENELYMLASLNLLSITGSEIKGNALEEHLGPKINLQKDIMTELETIDFSNSSQFNIILKITIQLYGVIYKSAHLLESSESISSPEFIDIISSIMTDSEAVSKIAETYPALTAVLFYLSSYCIVESTVKLKNLQTAYHYAKLTQNLSLMTLTSYHIYTLMAKNDQCVFSSEEIETARTKYSRYSRAFRLARKEAEVYANAKSTFPPHSSDGGQYDNEKNDNYYDQTVADADISGHLA